MCEKSFNYKFPLYLYFYFCKLLFQKLRLFVCLNMCNFIKFYHHQHHCAKSPPKKKHNLTTEFLYVNINLCILMWPETKNPWNNNKTLTRRPTKTKNFCTKKIRCYFFGKNNIATLEKHRQLNGNALASMDSNSLQHLPKLRTLRLEGNLFYRIPTNALAGLKTLEALWAFTLYLLNTTRLLPLVVCSHLLFNFAVFVI